MLKGAGQSVCAAAARAAGGRAACAAGGSAMVADPKAAFDKKVLDL